MTFDSRKATFVNVSIHSGFALYNRKATFVNDSIHSGFALYNRKATFVNDSIHSGFALAKYFIHIPRLAITTSTTQTRSFFDILPPPSGLDTESISTEAGLLEAINAHSQRIEEANSGGKRITHDEVRVIAFLGSEVRRRVEALDPKQSEEFEHVRDEARQREMSLSIDELDAAIEAFAESTKNPKAVITFSTINELEMRGTYLKQSLKQSPEAYAEYAEYLNRVQQALNRIKEIKNSGITGFPSFD